MVYAAEWSCRQVAIKMPAESHDCSFDDACSLLEHEEKVYRHLGGQMEGSSGASASDEPPAAAPPDGVSPQRRPSAHCQCHVDT